MNKQSIIFLTLFSFILVLSIYYVTLPTPPSDDILTTTVQVNSSSDIAKMQEELATQRANELKESNDIIGNSDSTTEQKQIAVKKVDEINNAIKTETTIVTTLKDIGYTQSFVEIADSVIKVTVKFDSAGSREAAEIIDIAKQLTEGKYTVEIYFL